MRAAGGLWPAIMERENFRAAFHASVAGKRDRSAVRAFAAALEERLDALRADTEAGTTPCNRFQSFEIRDPKQRTISAPCLEDRILHHAVMRVCEPVFERLSIFDSYACRTGKGQVKALERARHFSGGGGWFLKLDVRKYFDSIDRAVLEEKLARCFRERKLLDLLHRLVWGFQPGTATGLPIGSLTSQHFANFYLGHLDRHMKETLRVRRYVRYMDDFVLWDDDKARLQDAGAATRRYAQEALRLTLKAPVLQPVAHGLGFLGYRIYPHSLIVDARGRTRFRRKCRILDGLVGEGRITEAEAQQRADSLVAFTLAGKSRCLRWRQQAAVRAGGDQRGPEPFGARGQLPQ